MAANSNPALLLRHPTQRLINQLQQQMFEICVKTEWTKERWRGHRIGQCDPGRGRQKSLGLVPVQILGN